MKFMNPMALRLGSRPELIAALRVASVVEHMLALEYLFAGFSVRRTLADLPPESIRTEAGRLRGQADLDTFRPWLAQTYLIARQEMEHLGIVQNLLGALGEEPFLARPAFPVSSSHTLLQAPFRLDRFERRTLRRFVWYERPDYLTAEFRRRHGDPAESGLPGLEEVFLPAFLRPLDSVEKLYTAIGDAFATLDPGDLFRGDPGRQIPEDMFGLSVQMAAVTNRSTAAQAIQRILEQGEGIGESPQSGDPAHFERFLKILRELEQAESVRPGLDPALPVVSNPRLDEAAVGVRAAQDGEVTRITNPHTRRVMAFFNDAYSQMLVMMQGFFRTYSGLDQPSPRPQSALFYAAFFPLMTMVLRPLGEILTRMPADGAQRTPAAGEAHAGPDFGIVPEAWEWRDSATGRYPVIRTVLEAEFYRDGLNRLAQTAAALVEDVPEDQQANLQFLQENLVSTSRHLDSIWNRGQ